jgi:crossover junction endodeoxyribonuclease RuvC
MTVRILGIDPGLRYTGWGVIAATDNRLRHIADGVIATDSAHSVAARLCTLHQELTKLLALHAPHESAVEETYVNVNATATLKLGYARGVAMLVPALAGIVVHEYGAKTVKLSVVGTGNASKDQVALMVARLLPGAQPRRADAADALAVAICHAHHRATARVWGAA